MIGQNLCTCGHRVICACNDPVRCIEKIMERFGAKLGAIESEGAAMAILNELGLYTGRMASERGRAFLEGSRA